MISGIGSNYQLEGLTLEMRVVFSYSHPRGKNKGILYI